MSATEYRVGKNEALFREVNERIRSVSEDWAKGDRTSRIEFVCECSRESCFETVGLTVAEYEEVRSDPRRFLIVTRTHVVARGRARGESERRVLGHREVRRCG